MCHLFISQFLRVLTSLSELQHKPIGLWSFYWPPCPCFNSVAFQKFHPIKASTSRVIQKDKYTRFVICNFMQTIPVG